MEKESFWKSAKDKVFEKLPDTFVEGLFYKLNFSDGRNLANDSIEFFIVGHVLYYRSVNNYADCSYSPHKYTRCGGSVIVNICGYTFLDVRSANYKLVLIGCHPADLNTFQQLSFGSHLSLRSKFSKSSVELLQISKLVLISNISRKPGDYSTMHRCNAVLELVSESKALFAPELFAQAVQLLKKLNCVEFIVYQVESERPIYAIINLLASSASGGYAPPRIKTALELMNSLPSGRCGEWNIAMVLNPPSNYPVEEYQLESQKMMAACKDGSLAALRAALDRSNKMILTPHARDQGNWSPLEHVVQSALDCKNDELLFVRYLDCIKVLLDHGASPTARTKSGYSTFVDVLLGIRVFGIDRISKLAQPFWNKLNYEEKKRAYVAVSSSQANNNNIIELFRQNGVNTYSLFGGNWVSLDGVSVTLGSTFIGKDRGLYGITCCHITSQVNFNETRKITGNFTVGISGETSGSTIGTTAICAFNSRIDCCLIKLDDLAEVALQQVHGIGAWAAFAVNAPAFGQQVQLYSRQYGRTQGTITDLQQRVRITYARSGAHWLQDMIIVRGKNFSGIGDSGSLVLTLTSPAEVVGLLVGGGSLQNGDECHYITPVQHLVDAFPDILPPVSTLQVPEPQRIPQGVQNACKAACLIEHSTRTVIGIGVLINSFCILTTALLKQGESTFSARFNRDTLLRISKERTLIYIEGKFTILALSSDITGIEPSWLSLGYVELSKGEELYLMPFSDSTVSLDCKNLQKCTFHSKSGEQLLFSVQHQIPQQSSAGLIWNKMGTLVGLHKGARDGSLLTALPVEAIASSLSRTGDIARIPLRPFIDIFKSALHHQGRGEWKRVKLFLVGDAAAGKTSFLRWLTDEEFESVHIMTEGAELSTVAIRDWKKTTDKTTTESIANVLVEVERLKTPAFVSPNIRTVTAHLTVQQTPHQPISSTPEKQVSNQLVTLSDDNPTSQQTMITHQPPVTPQQSEEPLHVRLETVLSAATLEEIRAHYHLLRTSPTKLDTMFHVWDFAGQDDYYSMHQLFLTENSIYAVIVDLHPVFGQLELDRLSFWLHSIRGFAPGAPILIIGTHRDLVPSTSEVVKSLQAIRRHCVMSGFKLIVNSTTDSTYISPASLVRAVACNNPVDDEKKEIRMLLRTLAQGESSKFLCPLLWMLFYDIIWRDAQSDNITLGMVPEERAKALAHACGIKEIEGETENYVQPFAMMMEFFHNRGFFLYYTHHARFVFMYPQVLVNALRELLTLSYNLKQIKKPAIHLFQEEKDALKDYGTVTPSILERVWKKIGGTSKSTSEEICAILHDLLLHFDLALPDRKNSSNLVVPTLVEDSYIVIQKWKQIQDEHIGDISFEMRYILHPIVPLGFTTRLITRINALGVQELHLRSCGCVFRLLDIWISIVVTGGVVAITTARPSSVPAAWINVLNKVLEHLDDVAQMKQASRQRLLSSCVLCDTPMILTNVKQRWHVCSKCQPISPALVPAPALTLVDAPAASSPMPAPNPVRSQPDPVEDAKHQLLAQVEMVRTQLASLQALSTPTAHMECIRLEATLKELQAEVTSFSQRFNNFTISNSKMHHYNL